MEGWVRYKEEREISWVPSELILDELDYIMLQGLQSTLVPSSPNSSSIETDQLQVGFVFIGSAQLQVSFVVNGHA